MPTAETPGETLPEEGQRLAGIDLLRGLAIMWVVLFHLWASVQFGLISVPYPGDYYRHVGESLREGDAASSVTYFSELLLRIGDHGVTIFMILSGLSLTMVALRSGLSMKRYFSRRMTRLLFPYWAGLALLLVTLAGLSVYRTQVDGGTFSTNFQHIVYIEGRMPEKILYLPKHAAHNRST